MSSELDYKLENTPEAQGYLIPNTSEDSQLENTIESQESELTINEQNDNIPPEVLEFYNRSFFDRHPALHAIFAGVVMVGVMSGVMIMGYYGGKYNRKDKEIDVT